MFEWELMLRKNVACINNKSVVIGSTEIFFTTMWTRIPAEESYTIARIMNDCSNNRYEGRVFDTCSWNKIHKECLQWLLSAVEASSAENKVVVTHHCPHKNAVAEHYVGRLSGCGAAEVSHMHLRQRLFLAWAHRLPLCNASKVQC